MFNFFFRVTCIFVSRAGQFGSTRKTRSVRNTEKPRDTPYEYNVYNARIRRRQPVRTATRRDVCRSVKIIETHIIHDRDNCDCCPRAHHDVSCTETIGRWMIHERFKLNDRVITQPCTRRVVVCVYDDVITCVAPIRTNR